MRSNFATSTTLKIALASIFWFIALAFTLLCLPVVVGVSPLLLLAVVLLALIVALPVWGIRRKFSGALNKPSYWITWLAITLILVCTLGLPVFWLAYKSEAEPLTLPLVTLSNGEKTVVFQGMVHIGSENFYKSVVYDLEQALTDGYDLFYEGVQPGDAESGRWFNAFMGTGGRDLSGHYKALSNLCGVEFQLDYFGLLEADKIVHPSRHLVADVSHRQMLDEWNRLHPGQSWQTVLGAPAEDKANAGEDPMIRIMEFVQSSEGRQRVGGIVCRAMLANIVDEDEPDPEKDAVILDYRNRELANYIIEHHGNKIYITFGAAHLDGLVADLKARDPNWEVKSVRWVRAIEPPAKYDGELKIEG